MTIPPNYPVVGSDAFRTATGVHAAAIMKADLKEGDRWLRDLVYSGVPAHLFGAEQRIDVGPMSGRSNVIWWLTKHGFEVTEERIQRLFGTLASLLDGQPSIEMYQEVAAK